MPLARDHGPSGLETEIRALHRLRRQLSAAVGAEHSEAEAAYEAQLHERARVEAEIRALHEYRQRLAAAVDKERAEAAAAHRAQEEERARLEAEIHELEGHVERGAETSAAPVEGAGDEPGPVRPEPLDASGRLAAAVAELGRHLAAVLETERAQARRLALAQREARARLEAEFSAVDEQRDRQPVVHERAPRPRRWPKRS